MDGFVNINKPAGWTSHDVVAKLRSELKTKKVGHAGTLDPMATGVLVVGLGKATKLLEFLAELDKVYEAEIMLGKTSDTYDGEGKIVDYQDYLQGIGHRAHDASVHEITKEEFEVVMKQFLGTIQQVPPPFSSVRVNGVKAYELARRGKPVKLKPRPVDIFSITLKRFRYPKATIEVHCGSGTYIRSLAHDIGQRLKCGAYLSQLVRTKVGAFSIEDSKAIEHAEMNIQPLEIAIRDMKKVDLTDDTLRKVRTGQPLKLSGNFKPNETLIGLYCNDVAAVLTYDERFRVIRPRKVLI